LKVLKIDHYAVVLKSFQTLKLRSVN